MPTAGTRGFESAPATFSNPFGLGQSEPLDGPTVGDVAEAVRQGNGMPEEDYAAGGYAEPEEEAASVDQDRGKLREMEAELPRPLARMVKPEAFADMAGKSTDRRFNPGASIWSDVPDESPSSGQDRGVDPPSQSEPPAGFENPARKRSQAHDELPDNGAEFSPQPRPAGRSADASAPPGGAAGRREDGTPLIPRSDSAASGWSALASDSGPGGLDRGGERTRLSLRVPGSDLRRTDKQPSPQARPESRHRAFQGEPELPKFTPISSDVSPRDPAPRGAGRPAAQIKLWEAFTPSRPKYSSRFFAGRRWALQRIITAVEQDQAHIVIFGPRGIGKTSLANVLAESASEVEYQVLRYPCGSNATFEEIFRGLLRSLPAGYMDRATQARFAGAENLEQLLPAGEFGPTDVTAVLSQIKLEHAILIIDEFDRVESELLKNQLAEAMKNISDVSARVTFIIIGIAHSLDELIGMHPSIQRHLVGIHLPLMTASELEHVVLAGEEASGVRFEDATRDMIVSFSKGLPYYAQLLSLHAGRKALERGSMLVQMTDLRDALEMVLRESDPLAKASYNAATRDDSDQFLIDVLFAAATAPFDDYGTFTAESAAEMFVDPEGKKLPETAIRQSLDDLAQQDNARLIEKWAMPAAKTRYAFVLQTMRQYILLRQAVRRGLM